MAQPPRADEPYSNLSTENLKRGKHYHEFDGVKYDVDTQLDELCWEEILPVPDREGHPVHRVWKYYKDTVQCMSCAKTMDMKYSIQRLGVYARCMYCNVTFPVVPYDPEAKEERAELVKTEVVSATKAIEICARIGQRIPDFIQNQRPRERRKHE